MYVFCVLSAIALLALVGFVVFNIKNWLSAERSEPISGPSEPIRNREDRQFRSLVRYTFCQSVVVSLLPPVEETDAVYHVTARRITLHSLHRIEQQNSLL